MLDSTGARTLARNIVLAAQIKEKDDTLKKRVEQRRTCFDFIRRIPVAFWVALLLLIVCQVYHFTHYMDLRHMRSEYLDLSKHYLYQILSEDSPQSNVSLWLCPHGNPGPMAYNTPVRNVYFKQNVNARCVGMRKRCSALKIAKRVVHDLQKRHFATRIDTRMPVGPFPSDVHPHQEQYCLRAIAEYCEAQVEECPFYSDLMEYANDLVRVPCSNEHLMGAMGPPEKMDIYRCDVYLQKS